MSDTFVTRAFPETTQMRTVSVALVAIAGFVALMVAWAVIAKVPEVAKTRGEVQPRGGDVQMVQSLSGGKILRVLVEEGQVVEAGQVIANIDQSVTEADIQQLEVRHNDLLMQIERLTALARNRNPNFGAPGEAYPGLAAEQQTLFESEARLFRLRVSELSDELLARQQELEGVRNQVRETGEGLAIVQEEIGLFEQGVERGVISRQQLLEKQEKESDLANELEQYRGRMNTLQGDIETLQARRDSLATEIRTDFRTRRAELVEKLGELEQELIQAHASQGQNALTASADGIIKSLPNATIGAVLQPGGVVAEIVPSDQPLEVEVRVSPRDIGFVEAGQKVLIKVDAYDYSRFGAIQGEVIRVSPSTFKDERTGQPYFKATIQPASEFVGDESRERRIRVGMTAEADITTGHKTVFQYLLKPVYTTVDTALTER